MTEEKKMYKLLNENGEEYLSTEKGTLGGYHNGKTKIYGQLDCKNALNWIAKGHYVKHRVFFKDAAKFLLADASDVGICISRQVQIPLCRTDGGVSQIL